MNVDLVYDGVKHLGLEKFEVLNIIRDNKIFSDENNLTIEKDIYIKIFDNLNINDCSISELEELLIKTVKKRFLDFRNMKPIDKVSFSNGQIAYHGSVSSNSKEEIMINWIIEKMRKDKLLFSYGNVNKLLHIFIGNTLLTYNIKDLNINKTIRKIKRKYEYQTPYESIRYLKRHLH